MPPDVLLVTEPGFGPGMSRVLGSAGHRVYGCHSVLAACHALEQRDVDVTLIDLGLALAEPDATAALAQLRTRTPSAIVLIDSSWHPQLDQLIAAGADDFLAKPFSPAQLLARIGVVTLDRNTREPTIRIGDLTVNPRGRQACLDGIPLELSKREFDLLAYLAKRAGEVVTRRELATAVWNEPYRGQDHTIDVHLSWLRRKLGETAARPRYLHTVRGVGFRFAFVQAR